MINPGETDPRIPLLAPRFASGLFFTRKAGAGSTAKMLAAVALGRGDHACTLYCRAPIPGMRAAGIEGDAACRDRANWIEAQEAFARSDSAAVHWALRHHVRHGELEAIASAFGMPPLGTVPAATALSLGLVELTRAEMMRMAGAIGAFIGGKFRDVALPSVILEARRLDPQGDLTVQAIPSGGTLHGEDLRRAAPAKSRLFVSTVLDATSGATGTLRALRDLKAGLGGHLFAKTGTISVSGTTLTVQIAGAFVRGGQPWSFVVMVAGPDRRKPLGQGLVAGQFADLAKAALAPLDHSNSRTLISRLAR